MNGEEKGGEEKGWGEGGKMKRNGRDGGVSE